MSDTPKTDYALCQLRYYETRHGDRYEEQLTYIEPEFARELERKLIRAIKVVNAARAYKDDDSFDDTDSLNKLLNAVEEWEARHG